MPKRILMLGAGVIGAFMLAGPASAQSYMQQCNALISEWQACTAGGGDCRSEVSRIEEDCQCHTYRRNEWVLVTAAVGDDGVCGPRTPQDLEIPPPPPPPGQPIIGQPARGGGDAGGGEEPRPNDPRGGSSSSASSVPRDASGR